MPINVLVLEDTPFLAAEFMHRLAGSDVRLVLCPSAESAKLVAMDVPWSLMYLDHDLGSGETGLDFVKWLVKMRRVAANMDRPRCDHIIIHSRNPDGAAAMEAHLTDNFWLGIVERVPLLK